MKIDQEILIHCTDTEKDVKGKVIRLYRGGLDVAVQNAIIKLKLKNNNLYVGNLHGLEFTFIDKEIWSSQRYKWIEIKKRN